MNAGFSTLKYLKQSLLAEALRDTTEYDALLTALGQGVAAHFDRFTNRRLGWSAEDKIVFSGERPFVILPRYPVVAITGAETRFSDGDNWQAADIVHHLDADSGVVRFLTAPGTELSQVRMTWSGGYWWNTNESVAETMPAGATALPGDLLHAWLMQCEHIWNRRDKLGLGIAAQPDTASKLDGVELLPAVKERLTPFIRYQLT